MKSGRTILVLSLTAGLCVSGSVQAFCFLKGKDSGRSHNYYSYPMQASGFALAQYYSYPYSVPPFGMRYDQVEPRYMPAPQNNKPIEGIEVWRQ
ncbi:MAG: hypothetical protein WBO34_10050 [Gammaproteobacteria bacterium]